MKTSRSILWTFATVTLFALASTAWAIDLDETVEQSLPFAPGDSLDLENVNGQIHITGWDRNEIHIEARKRARGASDSELQNALDGLEVVIEERDGGVSVITRYPRRSESRYSRDRVSLSVDYRVTLPANADLDLETVNGKIWVEGVIGDLKMASTNGGIDIGHSGGRVDASTTNGGISVELSEVSEGEEMLLKTTNGSVSLYIPASARASLTARTTNGSILSDLPIESRGRVQRTRLEGDLNGGGARIEIKTTNGAISISEFTL